MVNLSSVVLPVNHDKGTHMKLLENLGRRVLERRGDQGVRAAAKEIGISHATLSRVERGFHPDLATLQKIATWLGDEIPAAPSTEVSLPQVHFRRHREISPNAAKSLAEMILQADIAWKRGVYAPEAND